MHSTLPLSKKPHVHLQKFIPHFFPQVFFPAEKYLPVCYRCLLPETLYIQSRVPLVTFGIRRKERYNCTNEKQKIYEIVHKCKHNAALLVNIKKEKNIYPIYFIRSIRD